MPEFHMDKGTSAREFDALDAFTQAYIEAMFWTSEEELGDLSFTDLASQTLKEIDADCSDFQITNKVWLDKAYGFPGYDESRAGHDYWLTRNRHGAGFWDRGLGHVGKMLTDAAHIDGECDAYVGDDGKIYV